MQRVRPLRNTHFPPALLSSVSTGIVLFFGLVRIFLFLGALQIRLPIIHDTQPLILPLLLLLLLFFLHKIFHATVVCAEFRAV